MTRARLHLDIRKKGWLSVDYIHGMTNVLDYWKAMATGR